MRKQIDLYDLQDINKSVLNCCFVITPKRS